MVSYLRDVGKHIAHLTGVDAINAAQGAFQLFVRWLGGVIRSVARDVRGKRREEAGLILFRRSVDDLAWTLQGDGRK